jgi:HEXXH motif-containing protein
MVVPNDMLNRVRAFIASGPSRLPDASTLFAPNAQHTADVIWPLVARRNLKRLTTTAVRLAGMADADTHDALFVLLGTVLELPDEALTCFLTQPEVTSWLVGAEQAEAGDAATFTAWLGQFVLAEVASRGGVLPAVPVATSSPHHVELRAWGRRLVSEAPLPAVVTCSFRRGVLSFGTGRWMDQHVEPEDTRLIQLPRLARRLFVSGGPNAWLTHAFPEVQQVAELDAPRLAAFAALLGGGIEVLSAVWPEAWHEVEVMLRWVVPLTPDDSFYVPGFRGLIAVGETHTYPMAMTLFHETSHNKFSSILELADASSNPDEPVFSPFARGKGPVTSLIHSCWSFAREYQLIQRLKAAGHLKGAGIQKLEKKFQVFFDKGIPSLRRTARLSPLGDAVLASIEQSIR